MGPVQLLCLEPVPNREGSVCFDFIDWIVDVMYTVPAVSI
jgi:hypothetical protein